MTIGVGFLSGKGGFWFGAGGFICYFLLSPLLSGFAGPEIAGVVSPEGVVVGATDEQRAIRVHIRADVPRAEAL